MLRSVSSFRFAMNQICYTESNLITDRFKNLGAKARKRFHKIFAWPKFVICLLLLQKMFHAMLVLGWPIPSASRIS